MAANPSGPSSTRVPWPTPPPTSVPPSWQLNSWGLSQPSSSTPLTPATQSTSAPAMGFTTPSSAASAPLAPAHTQWSISTLSSTPSLTPSPSSLSSNSTPSFILTPESNPRQRSPNAFHIVLTATPSPSSAAIESYPPAWSTPDTLGSYPPPSHSSQPSQPNQPTEPSQSAQHPVPFGTWARGWAGKVAQANIDRESTARRQRGEDSDTESVVDQELLDAEHDIERDFQNAGWKALWATRRREKKVERRERKEKRKRCKAYEESAGVEYLGMKKGEMVKMAKEEEEEDEEGWKWKGTGKEDDPVVVDGEDAPVVIDSDEEKEEERRIGREISAPRQTVDSPQVIQEPLQ